MKTDYKNKMIDETDNKDKPLTKEEKKKVTKERYGLIDDKKPNRNKTFKELANDEKIWS